MKMPLVSIVTPCYNGESYLDRYFNSILNQTYPNLELIFVNDGSSDNTEKIALSYKDKLEKRGVDFKYIYQKNAGQAAALNNGLKYFKGEYLTWPDSDDEMTPECIEKKVDFLEKNQDYDFCICRVACVDEDKPDDIIKVFERKQPVNNETFFDDVIFVNNMFMTPGGYMVRSTIVDSTIPDREIFTGRGGQNAQILLPISWYGKLGYMDDILYKYYVRSDSHSHSVKIGEDTVRQLDYYEKILVATLKKIPAPEMDSYIERLRKHYAVLKFGNAIDTKNCDIIRHNYKNLKKYNNPSFNQRLLNFKYTNRFMRKLYHLG